MSENYLGIMMRILSPHNYGYRIMVTEFWLPSICDDAEKLRFIGILAYPINLDVLGIQYDFKD